MPRELGETRHQKYRLIDTWIYKVKDVELDTMDHEERDEDDPRSTKERAFVKKERIVNKVVKIELRMEKETKQSEEPPHPTKSVRFEVCCPELSVKIEGTDIEALRAGMWDCLDKRFQIKWEKYYKVEVKRAHIWGGIGEGLEVIYDDVWKGTTWDGKILLRQWDHHRDYKIKPWPGAFRDEKGDVMACIPATKENEDALKEFCKRIAVLRDKLAEFLKPERIQATLTNLAGLALLPPAPTKKKKKEDEPALDV